MILGSMYANAIPSVGFAMSVSWNEKMTLPVSPANYIYSHFEHVSGLKAPDGSRGVAINKLKILDILIERLTQLKIQPQPYPTGGEGISDQQIDALIEQYEQQIHLVQAASAAVPYTPGAAAPLGMIFNLLA